MKQCSHVLAFWECSAPEDLPVSVDKYPEDPIRAQVPYMVWVVGTNGALLVFQKLQVYATILSRPQALDLLRLWHLRRIHPDAIVLGS